MNETRWQKAGEYGSRFGLDIGFGSSVGWWVCRFEERRERAGGRLVLGGVVMSGVVLMQGRLFLGIVAAIWEWLRVEPTMDLRI